VEDASGQPSDAILRGSGDAARRRALNILDRFQGIPALSIKMADVPHKGFRLALEGRHG
jgi:hypothetical protein